MNQKSRQTSKNQRFLHFSIFWRKIATQRFSPKISQKMMIFQNRFSQSWSEMFYSKIFCWTNRHVKLFKMLFLDRRRIFIGPAEDLCSPDFLMYPPGGLKNQLFDLIFNWRVRKIETGLFRDVRWVPNTIQPKNLGAGFSCISVAVYTVLQDSVLCSSLTRQNTYLVRSFFDMVNAVITKL